MEKRLIGPVVMAVTILLTFLVGNASAGCVGVGTGTVFGCGDTITESCTFNENLSCPSGHGLIIGVDDITIDGAGYAIDGVVPGTCMDANPRCGILDLGYDHNVIKNLELKNFCYGILLDYHVEKPLYDNTIENCRVHDNGYMEDPNDPDIGEPVTVQGIKLYGVFNSTISNNEVYNNRGSGTSCEGGGNGIYVRGISGYGGNNNFITRNKLYNNSKGGFFTKMMCRDNEVSYNEVWGNGQGGIILRCKKSDTFDIHHNNASYNYGDGIFIGGYKNVIRNNVVQNNKDGPLYSGVVGDGDGIDVGRSDGSRNNVLTTNIISENEDNGIEICSGVSGNSIDYNCVCENGDVDIHDGGASIGNNNTCDTTYNYDDVCVSGCTYSCGSEVIADFYAEPTKGAAPLTVNFTDKSKPEGNVTSWSWDFGGAATSDEQNPSHTYNATEPYSYYNVSLTVNRTEGESDTETKPDYIVVWRPKSAPNADFYCEKGVGELSQPVTFTDRSIGEVTSWAWDFDNDGVVDNTTQNPSHQYSEEGIYNVSLAVTGPGGSSRETKIECVRVGSESGEKRPLVDTHFFVSERNGAAPLTVKFTDCSKSEDELLLWRWDFGDGNTSNERNPLHTYNESGIYDVSLEVTNTEGAKAVETKTGYIRVTEGAFDTGKPANPYPSIFGTHNGTIAPDQDIIVNRMYTYSCKGTGGHTVYVRIWNESEGTDGVGHWSGYQSGYRNTTISPTITLLQGHEYNYTIITGSYPQIIHARSKHVTGGNITCSEFTDANGEKYVNWIPAIRLWYNGKE